MSVPFINLHHQNNVKAFWLTTVMKAAWVIQPYESTRLF
jgi:hypothetical protein